MSQETLAQSIARRHSAATTGPFPLADLTKLKEIDPFNWDRLHGELDLYFSSIAGYASGVLRLRRKPKESLITAAHGLSQEFFEKHPDLAHYKTAITPASTPELLRRLEGVDSLRADLFGVIQEILGKNGSERPA